MNTSDLADLTVTEAARRIAAGDITSEALVRGCLERIARLEPRVQAWAFLDQAYALDQARQADLQRQTGKGVGALHGVPIGIKDIIDTADMPTENGCPIFKGRLPREDATCVAALRRAGAVILGKTVTTELATLTPSRTRNPHNFEHTPGGSSSGSAAAVAAGMVPGALGTQTGGSVIRPSAFCGVYGFKPTFGTIARPGVLTQAPSLDTVGVHARSLDDVALLVEAMQSHDARDRASLPGSQARLFAAAAQDLPLPPLFAFVKTHAWDSAPATTHTAFAELREHLRDQVEEVSISLSTERGVAAARTVQYVELAVHYGPLLDRAPHLISKGLAERIETGRRALACDYLSALSLREELYRGVEELFNNYGTILTPAAPGPAPAGFATTGDPVFNAFWTYLGVPAITLPLLEVDGMPVGVQLVRTRGDDARLLATARWLVRHLEGVE